MNNTMKLGFKKIRPDAKLPEYAHAGDAGMDVCAVEEVVLLPFTPTLVRTGLIAEIPDGYEIQVRPRSGLALKHGITVLNSPGCIDSGYVGEIGVILIWIPSTMWNPPSMAIACPRISKGDRIAQLVLAPVTRAEVVEVDEVGETERGTGGFGSTGYGEIKQVEQNVKNTMELYCPECKKVTTHRILPNDMLSFGGKRCWQLNCGCGVYYSIQTEWCRLTDEVVRKLLEAREQCKMFWKQEEREGEGKKQ